MRWKLNCRRRKKRRRVERIQQVFGFETCHPWREAYVNGGIDLHWVGGVPVDVAQPVGGRGRLADQLNQQQQEVDDHFGRHFLVVQFSWNKSRKGKALLLSLETVRALQCGGWIQTVVVVVTQFVTNLGQGYKANTSSSSTQISIGTTIDQIQQLQQHTPVIWKRSQIKMVMMTH